MLPVAVDPKGAQCALVVGVATLPNMCGLNISMPPGEKRMRKVKSLMNPEPEREPELQEKDVLPYMTLMYDGVIKPIRYYFKVLMKQNEQDNRDVTPVPVSYTHLTLPTNREV